MVQAFIINPEIDLDKINDELVDLYVFLDQIAQEHSYSLQEWLHVTDKILSPEAALDYRIWVNEQWEPTTESVNNA